MYEYYNQGFLEKCAQYGYDPQQLVGAPPPDPMQAAPTYPVPPVTGLTGMNQVPAANQSQTKGIGPANEFDSTPGSDKPPVPSNLPLPFGNPADGSETSPLSEGTSDDGGDDDVIETGEKARDQQSADGDARSQYAGLNDIQSFRKNPSSVHGSKLPSSVLGPA